MSEHDVRKIVRTLMTGNVLMAAAILFAMLDLGGSLFGSWAGIAVLCSVIFIVTSSATTIFVLRSDKGDVRE